MEMGSNVFVKARSIEDRAHIIVEHDNGFTDCAYFNYNEATDSFDINGKSPQDYNPKDYFLFTPRDIDYEKINYIKSKNRGIVMPELTREEIIEKITSRFILIDKAEKDFKVLLEKEYEECSKANLGTKFDIKMNIDTTESRAFTIQFCVYCEGITPGPHARYNMYFQNISNVIINREIAGYFDEDNPIFIIEVKRHMI